LAGVTGRGGAASRTKAAPRSKATRTKAAPALPGYLALAAFAALYLAVWTEWPFPVWVHALYLAAGLATFLVYAADKRAAGTNRRRVSENTLHLLALVGGWPAAVIAQQTLRHKTAKRSFRAVFWLTALANTAALVALTTPVATVLRIPG
jgi:uncharacterized membrane protein YsdA (DUF1294 family)